ncbi:nucleotidyl transferase AbiEii/AbiGii toxin family protein [Paracoccus litorisediminis]|uniref:nucleotidyl transferase AbiEii/AbiGii toxin family protein n=1 Tax=Paracoccus litorisediminis TaxID=2006130 RepID=UPI00373327B8
MTDQPSRRLKRSELSVEDRIGIAARLQLDALDLVRQANSGSEGMVFHGGTSIAFSQGSPRWSEDLDFMATPDAVTRIFSRAGSIGTMLQLKSSVADPGATVELTRKKGGDGVMGEVAKLNIRWEHPQVIGAVKIKVEFYTCPQTALENYTARAIAPRWLGNGPAGKVATAIPESVWADKIVALALRPALKYRDIHDLGYISPKLIRDFDRTSFLQASMGIYGKSAEDIASGLERPEVVDHIAEKDAYMADMERWFSPDLFAYLKDYGRLDDQHAMFMREYERARRDVNALISGPDFCC